MPTQEQIDAAVAAYSGPSPFAEGITSTDYSALIRTYGQGETCRFYQAIPVDAARENVTAEGDGNVYVEATLAAGVQVFVHETKEEEEGGEWGVLPVGTTMLACMPADMWPVRGDRFVLTTREDRARVLIERATSGLVDTIAHSPLVAVKAVRNGSTLYTPTTHYTVSGQSITWVGLTKPTNGIKYSVEFSYRPTFKWFDISSRLPRIGADGIFLPLRGMLRREQVIGAA